MLLQSLNYHLIHQPYLLSFLVLTAIWFLWRQRWSRSARILLTVSFVSGWFFVSGAIRYDRAIEIQIVDQNGRPIPKVELTRNLERSKMNVYPSRAIFNGWGSGKAETKKLFTDEQGKAKFNSNVFIGLPLYSTAAPNPPLYFIFQPFIFFEKPVRNETELDKDGRFICEVQQLITFRPGPKHNLIADRGGRRDNRGLRQPSDYFGLMGGSAKERYTVFGPEVKALCEGYRRLPEFNLEFICQYAEAMSRPDDGTGMYTGNR
jgi:hypothetical protein